MIRCVGDLCPHLDLAPSGALRDGRPPRYLSDGSINKVDLVWRKISLKPEMMTPDSRKPFSLAFAIREKRVSKWVEGGNTASSSRSLLSSADYDLICKLEESRLMLNQAYGLRLVAVACIPRDEVVKKVKEFCGGLLTPCVRHAWKPLIRRRPLRTRVAVSSALFSFRKTVVGAPPSAFKYIKKMSIPQDPPSGEYLTFIREEVARIFPRGWDGGYWNNVSTFSPSTSACLDAPRSSGGARGLAVNGDVDRQYCRRWLGGTVVDPIPPGVRVTAVRAGKWRLVTLSSWMRNLLKPLHATIDKHLRKTSWLLCGEAKPECFRGFERKAGEVFVSGDYESATDNLNFHVSRHILGSLLDRCTHVPLRVREEAIYSLSAEFSGNLGMKEPYRVQQRGQLMGCLLSFPLLCLTNFLAYKYLGGCEESVKINGDDIVFRSSREFADRWMKFVGSCGLTLCQAKTLVSSSWFSVNSTYFFARPRRIPILCPTVRLNCFFGGVESVQSFVGRLGRIRVGLRGECRRKTTLMFLRKYLSILYCAQRSFRRGLLLPLAVHVLRPLRLVEREAFYTHLNDEPSLPDPYVSIKQSCVPEGYHKSRPRALRGRVTVSDDVVKGLMLEASWTSPFKSYSVDSYWSDVRKDCYHFSRFSDRAVRLFRLAGGCFDPQIRKVRVLPTSWVVEPYKEDVAEGAVDELYLEFAGELSLEGLRRFYNSEPVLPS